MPARRPKSAAARSRRRTAKHRDAETTCRDILDVSEELLAAEGLTGVTLDAVATRVGITRQGVLHHYGSREGLLAALRTHLTDHMHKAFLEALRELPSESRSARDLAHLAWSVHDRYASIGRISAHLALVGQLKPEDVTAPWIQDLAVSLQESSGAARGEEALFAALAGTMVAMTEVLFGPLFYRCAGLPATADVRDRFRSWTIDHLMDGIDGER